VTGVQTCALPICLLVLLSNEIDELLQVMIYEQGIDDLLIKPVNPLLMLAHIRALFRRNCRRGLTANLDFNGLKINGSTRQASYRGEDIPLSSREFDLLWYLAQNACMTLDRDRLYKNVFGVEYNGYDRSIDMYISRLRTKLSESTGLPPVIKTVRGKGYLFVVED
jgi:two-component system response regulator RstA